MRPAHIALGLGEGFEKDVKDTGSRLHRACVAGVLVLAWGGLSQAQTRATPGASLNRFEPAETGSDWFANESLDLRGTIRPALGVVGDFAYKSYVLKNPDGSENTVVVGNQFYLHLGGALVLFDRLRLGVSLPVAVVQDGNDKVVGGQIYVAPTQGGIGDLRLALDLRLVGQYGEPFTASLGGRLWIPTGDELQYVGDGQVRVGPRLAVAGDVGEFAYAAGVGVVYRANDTPFNGHPTGTEADFNVALGARLADKALLIGPELAGSTIVSNGGAFFGDHTTPLALLIGGHYNAGDVRLGLGAGPGLSNAAGTAAFRALASLEWFPAPDKPPPPDRDGDAIADAEDACIDTAGVRTNDPKTNGCPVVADRDNDGIADRDDACPDTAGVATDDPKTNGCPSDRDGDGVADGEDACPDVAGSRSDDRTTNGCPPDRDKDGVADASDACPEVPGVKTDDQKTNGCPSDRDKDGIVDGEDACPDLSGPRNADAKKNGCPLVAVQNGQVTILEQIKFKTNSAEIVDSQTILDAVAKTLTEHPEIKHLRVQGHTDSTGALAYNKNLSRQRAAAVVAALVKTGVSKDRLSSAGFGPTVPIADNGTEEGRTANRRVEFHIEDSATTKPPR
jgi:OOP family OmpA-OmpF porin